MKKYHFTGIALIICLLALTWMIITPTFIDDAYASTNITAAHPGFKAPEFSLQNLEGETVSLSDYSGQPVLVFLWASWCSICKSTMPNLQSVYNTYAPKGFEILAINTTYQDTLSTAERYFQTQAYTYTMLLDRDSTVSRDYQLYAIPTSVLVGPDGMVLETIIGAGMSEGFLRARLDEFYNEN